MPCVSFLLLYNTYHKFGGLKQHTFVISQFLLVRSLDMEQLGSLFRVSRCQLVRVLIWSSLSSLRLLAEFSPSCRTEAPVFLLADVWGVALSSQRPPSYCSHMAFSQHGSLLFQSQQENLSLIQGRPDHPLKDSPDYVRPTRAISLLLTQSNRDLNSIRDLNYICKIPSPLPSHVT